MKLSIAFLIIMAFVAAPAARADLYSEVAGILNPDGGVLWGDDVRAWFPAYVGPLGPPPTLLGASPTDEAKRARSYVVTWFQNYAKRAPSDAETINWLASNLEKRWETTSTATTIGGEARRTIAAINDIYLKTLGWLPSDREALYWLFRVSYAGLNTIRYEIATSAAAGKRPKLDRTKIPLGSQKYTTEGPRQGYVFTCDPNMYRFPNVVGARVTGPWVGDTTYNALAKPSVQGSVSHSGAWYGFSIVNDKRVFNGNGLPPEGIPTGLFPVQPTDPAFTYDSNPNGYVEQKVSFALPSEPVLAAKPFCMYKEAGITLAGLPITGPLDSSGRDEPGYEVQDDCGGTTQPGGLYHYHGQPNCLAHATENEALVGYALDGFGIYSSYDADGNELTTADLDECHGRTSPVLWNGKRVSMYHYVITSDYPYVVGCFRGKPVWDAFPSLPH